MSGRAYSMQKGIPVRLLSWTTFRRHRYVLDDVDVVCDDAEVLSRKVCRCSKCDRFILVPLSVSYTLFLERNRTFFVVVGVLGLPILLPL